MPGATCSAGSARRRPSASSTVTAPARSASRRSAAERARPRARPVEVAADEQEEQQHDRAVEIGVRAAADRLGEAHRRSRAGRRSRSARPCWCGRRAARPRPRGRTAGRRRRSPAARSARRTSAAGRASPRPCPGVPGPDRDREQHDVGGGEARRPPWRAAAPSSPASPAASASGSKGTARKPSPSTTPTQRAPRAAGPRQASARRRVVRLTRGLGARGLGLQRALDPAHAAAAMHALDHQVQAVRRAVAHEGRRSAALGVRAGGRRASSREGESRRVSAP